MRDAEFTLVIRCKLGDEYFEDWNSLPAELKAFWDKPENSCDCEGTGEMGTWCNGCPFCQTFEIEEI